MPNAGSPLKIILVAATLSTASLGADWFDVGLGNPAIPGTASAGSSSSFSIEAAGTGISETSDEGHFLHQDVSGNLEVIARVDSVENTNANAIAGLMVRQALGADAPFLLLAVTPQNGLQVRFRSETAAETATVSGPQVTAPVWLRLVRSNTTFSAFYSADGNAWTSIASQTADFGDYVHAGLAVSSHDAGVSCTAEFSKVAVLTNVPQLSSDLRLWLRSDIGVTADGSGLVSQWDDQSGNGNSAVQTTTANKPLLVANTLDGKPVLRFVASSNDFLSVPDHASLNPSQLSVFVVAKRSSGSTGVSGLVTKFAGSGNSGFILGYSAATTLRYWIGGTQIQGTAAIGNYDAFSATFDQQNMELCRNGSSLDAGARTAGMVSGTSPLFLGTQSSAAFRFDGDIVEVLVYGAGKSSLQRRDIEAYFHAKYGVGQKPASDAPAIAIPSGTYSTGQMVTLTVPAGHRVYYTVDGSAPTGTSTLYTGAFSVTSTTTVRAIAVRTGFAPSAEATSVLAIDPQSSYVSRSGLLVWLRADLGVTGTSAVTQWADQSGNLRHATQGASNRPALVTDALSGKPVIRFNSAAHTYLAIADSPALDLIQGLSLYAVTNRSSGTAAAVIAEKHVSGSSGYSLQAGTSAGVRNFYTNAGVSTCTLASSTAFTLLGGAYDRVQRKLYADGLESDSDNFTAAIVANANPFYIGGRAATLSLDGDIAELFLFDHALSEDERRELSAYVYLRYGVGNRPTATMPASNVVTGTYASAPTATLTAQNGATIHYTYTTNGETPTELSPTYTTALSLTGSGVLKAVAVKPGYLPSAVMSHNISLDENSASIARTGLALWLRADVGVSSVSSAVERWEDQSGNLNHAAQSTAAYRPLLVLNGVLTQPVIRYGSASHSYLEVPHHASLSSAQATVFAVVKRSAGTGAAIVVEKFNASGVAGYSLQATSDVARAFQTNGVTTSFSVPAAPAPDSTRFALLSGRYDQVNRSLHIDGLQKASAGYTLAIEPTTQPVYIGGRGNGSSLDGDIAEILYYNRALTPQENQAVAEYIYGRYPVDPRDDDGDQLTNGQERLHGTNPALADTDADGVNDFDEVRGETDPMDPGSNALFSTGLRVWNVQR